MAGYVPIVDQWPSRLKHHHHQISKAREKRKLFTLSDESTIQRLLNDIGSLCKRITVLESVVKDLKSLAEQNLSSSRLSDALAPPLINNPSTSKITSIAPASPFNTVTTVHKVMKDVDRRRSNVIISGLKPRSNVEDSSLVMSLFERHFSILIRPSSVRCRRIDKPKDGSKPSRILVHLGSQNLASEILSQERKLRLSDDQDIRLNVYISRDMSPEESRLAFEERVRRRAKKSSTPSSNLDNGVDGGHLEQNNAHNVSPLSTFVSSIPSTPVPIITDSSQFPPLCSQSTNSIVYSGPQPVYNAHVWTPAGPSANRGPGDYQQGGHGHQPPIYSSIGGHINTIPSTSYPQQHSGLPESHNVASTMPTGMFHAPIIHMPPPMHHQLASTSINSDSFIPHPSQFVSSAAAPMLPSSVSHH